jgi:anti-sigma-K factor RskA
MNDDSSGIDGTGSESAESDSKTRASESADLIRMLVEGFEPIDPRPDVWDRIDKQLWGANKPRHNRRRLSYLTAAAAAIVLIGITGALATIASRTGSETQPVMASQASVIRDLSDPTTGDIELTIHTELDGSSIAISTGSLPALDPASTYQLWSVVGDEVVSVGVFGPSIGSAPLRLEGNPAVLALTVETTGGVAVSSATPVAIWTSTG